VVQTDGRRTHLVAGLLTKKAKQKNEIIKREDTEDAYNGITIVVNKFPHALLGLETGVWKKGMTVFIRAKMMKQKKIAAPSKRRRRILIPLRILPSTGLSKFPQQVSLYTPRK
jgi:hypothetical protein